VALEPKPRRKSNIPWWPIILLLASVYLFWVLPHQLGDRPVDVEFETPEKRP